MLTLWLNDKTTLADCVGYIKLQKKKINKEENLSLVGKKEGVCEL